MLSADEMLVLISKQWANVSDIMKIGNVGKNKAQEIKRTIKNYYDANAVCLPYGLIPMEKVVEYFQINISYLKKVQQKKETR